MTLSSRRWLIMAAGVLANMCMGAGYAFSVFRKGLMDATGCTLPQVMMAYSLSFAFLPLGMLVGGVISRRKSPGVAVLIGGVLFGLGVIGAGLASSVYALWLTYGFMVSFGNGIVYATVIAVSVRWFPERKGFASGIVVAALGVGTMIIALVGQKLVVLVGTQDALKWLGISFFTAALIASRFIADPPPGYAPAGWNPAENDKAAAGRDMTWREMLAQPVFWVLFVTYICAASPGLLLISQAKDVAVDITGLGDLAAASMVGLLGAANSAGRFAWGSVSDRIGRLNALGGMQLISAVTMLALAALSATKPGLIVGFVLTGLCYGGALGTFPSVCADRFGSKNMEVNYALLFVAFSAAGMIGYYGAQLKAATGGYTGEFTVCAALAGLGVLLVLGMKLRGRSAPTQ